MKLNYRESQSTVRPDLIDSSSSKKYSYIRRNITETKVDDTTFYSYEEAKLTKEEFEQYLQEVNAIDIQQLRADIDYLLMISDLGV